MKKQHTIVAYKITEFDKECEEFRNTHTIIEEHPRVVTGSIRSEVHIIFTNIFIYEAPEE